MPVSVGLNLQEDDAKSFDFSKSADDGSHRASEPSRTCPDVPNEFRVSSGKQESRLILPQGLGMLIGSRRTWHDPELLAVSRSSNSCASFLELTLQFLNLSHMLIHC